MRNARVTTLVSGGSAASRLRLVEALHAIGRTCGSPLLAVGERTGRDGVLRRLTRRDIEGLAPATVFLDCADCLDESTVRLVARAADIVDEHWLAEPGRLDGVRLILGARDPSRLAHDLIARTFGAHVVADRTNLSVVVDTPRDTPA